MTGFDEIAENKGDKEWLAWREKVFKSLDKIAIFVAGRRGGGEAKEIVKFYRGSFNLCIRVRFKDTGPDAIIRFPKPGHTAFRDEKVEKEVQFMRFLSQNTTIPFPRLISWGSTAESPQQLGPFIITDYVNGTHLSDILKKPTQTDHQKDVLNPNIDEQTLDIIYDQIADYLLQISKLNFTHIGAISEDSSSKTWSVTGRPLTYNMNELATTITDYPTDKFPTAPFASATEYFQYLSNERLIHLWTQRNLASSPEDSKKRYIARHIFAQLSTKYCIEDRGPFKPFCDDMRPANMLVDKESLHITAVLDLEFTNVLPAQFAYDPPWWLLLVGPDMWLERGHSMDEFVALYEPRMEQFLRALERVESRSESMRIQLDGLRLSSRMRDSWKTKRFWFNYAARKSFDVDALFYAQLAEQNVGIDLLDDMAREGLESFVQMKMEQLKAYDKECNALFS